MYMFEYTQKRKFNELSGEQKVFMAKVIMNDVKQIALEKNISEQLAYDLYSKGLFGSDRIVG
ncbi:hypothetical protein D7V86_26730 [bacterium D16-51]|nr:hypothetical protein D7V96_26415 [bacterium D16-59]RKI51219.1 hypothetical protein D7V86_26730 [bacterium D16-51]